MSAFASAVMFFRWRTIGKEMLQLVWPLYGWASGLTMIGSCCGVVTWLAWMFRSTLAFKGRSLTLNGDQGQSVALFAEASIWWSVFKVFYAVEFYCVSVTQLLCIGRLAEFADDTIQNFVFGPRVVLTLVLAGNAVGLCALIVSAVYSAQSAQTWYRAAEDFATNNATSFDVLNRRAFDERELALRVAAVQYFCEVVVLLTIVATFLFVGFACARRVKTLMLNLRDGDNEKLQNHIAALSKRLNSKIVGTTAVIFATLLLRSVYSTMFAIANHLQDQANPCSSPLTVLKFCDTSCYNMYTRMQVWIDRTPEFQMSAVLMSSPFALFVARWGVIPQLPDRRIPRNVREGL